MWSQLDQATGHYRLVKSVRRRRAGVTRPTYDADANALVWARTNLGSGTGNRIVRYTLPARSSATQRARRATTRRRGPQLGAATSASLDGGDGANSCDDGGVHYCNVTVTGPLSSTLKP